MQKKTSNKNSLLAASILSANFARLGEEVKSVEEEGADWLHIDVMDGHFVPNLTFGPMVVQTLRPLTKLPLDCHLMVSDPAFWIPAFAGAGAEWITVHAEATPHLNRVLSQIRELGCKAGVSLNPASSLACIEEVLDDVDLVLLMSVNPGFGGQKFIESSVSKVKRLSTLRGSRSFLIEIDGGINPSNVEELKKAGVDVFVAGSAIFSASDRAQAIAQFKSKLRG